jgi:ATP-dependent helicase/nuclease subunit B
MRKAAGLLLPERKIGLSAHDFQQGIAAPSVVLSRSIRGAEAQTVPSRWMNRLVNLMEGLPGRGGPDALKMMRDRGKHWLAMAEAYARQRRRLRRQFAPRHVHRWRCGHGSFRSPKSRS